MSNRILVGLGALVLASSVVVGAPIIIATGQNNGDPTHASGNFFYSINTLTGFATPISPMINGPTPSGLASTADGRLLGYTSGGLVEIDPFAGTWTTVAPSAGLTFTGFDVVGNTGYGVPVSGGDRRLHSIDLTSGAATPRGSPSAIGGALDAFYGVTDGTTSPFVIGLGSVGAPGVATLYGVHLQSGGNQLLAIDPITGEASVVGALNSVGTSGNPGDGAYSGFAAMTGVDEDGDGVYDALFGNANFFDPDGSGPLGSQRFGGVVRYDLSDGTWDLVGSNPGIIFFGFASIIPSPGAALAMSAFGVFASRRRR